MRKTVATAMAMVLGMGLLAGCGSKEPVQTSTAQPVQEETAAETAAGSEIDFPTKEITLIVPFSAGGATDIMARQMQPIFKDKLNANLVVKNVEGGGSLIGVTEALTAKNDGYTLGLATSSFIALDAQGMSEIGVKDGTNISSLCEDPMVLVVKNGGKYDSVEDFIAAAKEKPGQISICQAGTNNPSHAFAKLLGLAADVQFLEIAYDGASRSITEIIGGNVDATVCKPADCITQVQAGELKIIGTFTHERVDILADVPTMEELGYDVFSSGEIAQVSYIVAPKDLDPAVRTKLAEMFETVITSEEFQQIADERGFVSEAMSGDELDSYINGIYDGLKYASDQLFTQ